MDRKLIFGSIGLLIIGVLAFSMIKRKKRESYRDTLIDKIRLDVIDLDPRIPSLRFHAGKVSESIDKKDVYLCLKDQNGKYYDYNMLIYVTLHELSHCLSKAIDEDHKNTSQEFIDNFNILLKKAEAKGIYDPSIPKVKKYCGVE